MDVDQYKTETRPSHRRSKLDPYAKDIRALLADGYSYAQVVDWLATKGLTIRKQSLGDWLRRRARHPAPASLPVPRIAVIPQPSEPSRPSPTAPTAVEKIFGQPVNLDHYSNIKRRTPK
jgi:hypothetical protein